MSSVHFSKVFLYYIKILFVPLPPYINTLFGSLKYIKWLKESIIPLSPQAINLIMKDSLTDLCNSRIVWEADSSIHFLMPVHLNQLWKVKTMVLKWVIVKGRNLNIRVRTSTILSVIVCTWVCMCMYVYIPFNACCTRCSTFWDVLASLVPRKTTNFTVYAAL